ncbi:hypothetical protein [Rugamonas rubra]|uniref:Uncharacterized protein n=1 Tax=Rugamonas rubra TaxID=758825 RepID=A0A1I4SIX6_9BURK|nr:hypothetical protein [Rugamonas rubra]SFM64399.1 hypothetical protein SAMN02982985_04804 [Rugamonas rubra]
MITEQITQLVLVGQLALEGWRLQETASNAEHAYHLAIHAYEREHGQLNKLIHKDAPEHAAVREFTSPKYQALQKARRRVYAHKTRLAKACAKLARMSAARPQGGAA